MKTRPEDMKSLEDLLGWWRATMRSSQSTAGSPGAEMLRIVEAMREDLAPAFEAVEASTGSDVDWDSVRLLAGVPMPGFGGVVNEPDALLSQPEPDYISNTECPFDLHDPGCKPPGLPTEPSPLDDLDPEELARKLCDFAADPAMGAWAMESLKKLLRDRDMRMSVRRLLLRISVTMKQTGADSPMYSAIDLIRQDRRDAPGNVTVSRHFAGLMLASLTLGMHLHSLGMKERGERDE